MIIGISGKKQSGKDSTGKIIQYFFSDFYKHGVSIERYFKMYDSIDNMQHTYEIKKYANKLKQLVASLIGCTIHDLEDEIFKNQGLGIYRYRSQQSPKLIFPSREQALQMYENHDIIKQELTPRLLLQEIGTDCFRDIIHPNIWVELLFVTHFPTSNWIITDVRFPNECRKIKEKGGFLLRINRKDIPLNNHISETALDEYNFDYVINNDDSITKLADNIKNFLKLKGLL